MAIKKANLQKMKKAKKSSQSHDFDFIEFLKKSKSGL
jgi:hypothetical protein